MPSSANALRDGTDESVVGKGNIARSGVAECARNSLGEIIIVDEENISLDTEYPRRNWAIVGVETNVHEGQLKCTNNGNGEPSLESIIAQINLVEISQFVDIWTNDAAEVIGICMKDGNVRKKADEAIKV